jgi:hypothetical protein
MQSHNALHTEFLTGPILQNLGNKDTPVEALHADA